MGLALGSTVTGGIQDISALLPLLGTEQCEKHVSSTLLNGFLYAAATPLSIFGSLGVVRAGVKALVASVVFGFRGKKVMGAETLSDMGFESTGDVLSQIMWKDGCHIAEKDLDKTLEDLHTTDLKTLTVDITTKRWNRLMLIVSLGILLLSITPYIFLIENTDDLLLLRLFFPLARSIGSLVISVMLQILIQTRLLKIIKCRLVFLTVNKFIRDEYGEPPFDSTASFSDSSDSSSDSFGSFPEWWNTRVSSEAALYRLGTQLSNEDSSRFSLRSSICHLWTCFKSTKRRTDESTELPLPLEIALNDAEEHHLATTPHIGRTIFMAQFSIACGILLTVVGYIGCFSLVQSSSNSFGPLIWLLTELALSIVRMGLWGWNPAWDEKQTYLTFSVGLVGHSPSSTCDKFYEDLEAEKKIPLTPAREFLQDIRSYVGWQAPVKILGSNIDLYYTMTRRRSDGERVLYVTIADHNMNVSWTLVYPKQPKSKSDRRGAQIGVDRIATLTELSADTSVDRAFIEDLQAHCDTILRKLKSHTRMDALMQGLSEVPSEDLRAKARALATTAGFNLSEEIHEYFPTTLEWRLLKVLAMDRDHVTPQSYVEGLKETVALKQALKQGRNREQTQRLAKEALRKALGCVHVHVENPTRQTKKWLAAMELAEVVVFGLMLAQRQEQQGIGQLTEVVSELAAHIQDEDDCKALDVTLTLLLVLKLWDSSMESKVRAEVERLAEAEVQESIWAAMRHRGEGLYHDTEEWVRVWAAVEAEKRRSVEVKVEASTRFIASAMATTLRRAQTSAPTQWKDRQHRPTLKIRLTWTLKPMETEQADKKMQTEIGRDQHYPRRPLTDDDLDDIAQLEIGELEVSNKLLCSKIDEWVEKSLHMLTLQTLQPRNMDLRWAPDDAVSNETIVEILMLVGHLQLERRLFEQYGDLREILKRHSQGTTARLNQRRGSEDPAKSLTYELEANARSRVTEQAARVRERLCRILSVARARIRQGGHSEQAASVLKSEWECVERHITNAWSSLQWNIERSKDGGDSKLTVYTLNTLCRLVKPQSRAQMQAWLAGEQQLMKEEIRKVQSIGYDEFLAEYTHLEAATSLVRLLLSKTSKFVRLPSFLGEENDFTRILRLNTAVRCVDCTACTLGEITDIVSSAWEAKSVSLILPIQVLSIPPTLETALQENKSILSFNAPAVTAAIQANRRAAEEGLKRGDVDGPLIYYENVQMASDSSHVIFNMPGWSRCTVSFFVPAKYLAHGTATGQLALRLLHCRTSLNTKIDIHLDGDANNVPWDLEKCPLDLSVQDIVLPSETLRLGLNTLTITLRRQEDRQGRQFEEMYWLGDVQLWPPLPSKKLKLLELDSFSRENTIPNLLGESTVVSCGSHSTPDQLIDIIDVLQEAGSVTLLDHGLDFDVVEEAAITRLQAALQVHQNVLSLNSSKKLPNALEEVIQANRRAALKQVYADETFVYFDAVRMIDGDGPTLELQKPSESRCTVLFYVPVKSEEATHGAVTGPLILRLDQRNSYYSVEVDIRLNNIDEVPRKQKRLLNRASGVEDVIVPKDMLTPGVNILTVTLRRGKYRMRDVQLVWS